MIINDFVIISFRVLKLFLWLILYIVRTKETTITKITIEILIVIKNSKIFFLLLLFKFNYLKNINNIDAIQNLIDNDDKIIIYNQMKFLHYFILYWKAISNMINFISQIIIDSGNRDFSPTIIIIIQKNTRVINQPIKKKSLKKIIGQICMN